MKAIRLLVPVILLLATPAMAAEATGSGALALAALAGNRSPVLGSNDKKLLLKMLNGETKFSFPAGQKITIKAEKVTCKASNVDITLHSCDLTFGSKTVSVSGRVAHELYATLIEIGIESEGAAGSVYAALSKLNCTVDPNEVSQNSGGGASCKYSPGS